MTLVERRTALVTQLQAAQTQRDQAIAAANQQNQVVERLLGAISVLDALLAEAPPEAEVGN